MFKKIEKWSFSNIFFILVIIGTIGLWYYQKEKNKQSIPSSSFSNTLSPTIITTPNDKSLCEKLGGRWQSVDSPDNRHICNLPTTDGGNKCTDSSQCESFCQAKEGTKRGQQTTGQCYAWKESITSCFTEVKNGISEFPICY